MDTLPDTAAEPPTDASTPTPAPVPPTSQPRVSHRAIKILIILVAVVVAIPVVIAGAAGVLAIGGVILFVGHCNDNYQSAQTAANGLKTKFEKLTINGSGPSVVNSSVGYSDGEDITCSSNVPHVTATFNVDIPSVTAAQAIVLRDMHATAAGTFTILTKPGDVAQGLDQPILTSSRESYAVRYYFPEDAPYETPADESCLNVMPLPPQCRDSSIVAANHLTSQPVAHIRLSN